MFRRWRNSRPICSLFVLYPSPSSADQAGFGRFVHALSILREGYPLLPSGAVSWSGAGAHYPMALGLHLFDGIHLGSRFFSAAAGTLLLAAFYAMNVRLFGSLFGSLASPRYRSVDLEDRLAGGLRHLLVHVRLEGNDVLCLDLLLVLLNGLRLGRL